MDVRQVAYTGPIACSVLWRAWSEALGTSLLKALAATEIAKCPPHLASKMHALCKNLRNGPLVTSTTLLGKNFCRAFRRSKIARTRIERTSKFADANRRSR